MIISQTPFRISFFGGGTDYPAWYRQHGGAVLSTSVNKYCYLTCRYLPPFFKHRTRVVWSLIDSVKANDEIRHPSVRATLSYLEMGDGLEIHYDGDLPARSGIGSSSSFTVGLLNALHALRGISANKRRLAREAHFVEQEILKENVGSQDQIAAAFGGLNRIDFHPDGSFIITPLELPGERIRSLERCLMLFFTGISRTASEIAGDHIEASRRRAGELAAMREMVDEAIALLDGGRDLDAFGALLDESWQLKKTLSRRVSTDYIDGVYAAARRAGALGGKLLGAGGGGFLLFFVRPEDQARVRRALGSLLHVPFRFEFQGSRIIFDKAQADAHRRELPSLAPLDYAVAPLVDPSTVDPGVRE